MEIERTHTARPRAIPPQPAAPRDPAWPTPEQHDLIDLSEGARRLGESSPDEASGERVRALREQLDAGEYEVDHRGLAQKIVERGEL